MKIKRYTKTIKSVLLLAIAGILVVSSSVFAATKYENYVAGYDDWAAFQGTIYDYQTFTPSISHDISSVKIQVYKQGSPGTYTVVIRATADGKPTGANLCIGTSDGDTLTTDEGGEWREVTFGSSASLTATTKYAIVAYAATGDGSNRVKWLKDNSGSYAGGNMGYSEDSGSNWTAEANTDFMFEEWGTASGGWTTVATVGGVAETNIGYVGPVAKTDVGALIGITP